MQTLYEIFSAVAAAPQFNLWISLFFLAAPAQLIYLNASSSYRQRVIHLLIAAVLAHLFLFLSGLAHYHLGWENYRECQSQFPDGLIQRHEECGNPPGGPNPLFVLVLGWIPAAGYITLCYAIWLSKYRVKLNNTDRSSVGIWMSALVYWLLLPAGALVVAVLLWYVFAFAYSALKGFVMLFELA